MQKSILMLFFACLLSSVFAEEQQSQTKIYQGTNPFQWSNGTFWSPPGVPTANDAIEITNINAVYIPNGTVISNLKITGSTVFIAGIVQLTGVISFAGNSATATLNVTETGSLWGSGTVEGGTVLVYGSVTVSSVHVPFYLEIDVASGAYVEKVVDGQFIKGGSLTTPSIGTLQMSIDLSTDRPNPDKLTVNNLVLTGPISVYSELAVRNAFELKQSLSLYCTTNFHGDFTWDSGTFTVSDTDVHFMAQVLSTANATDRTVSATAASSFYFLGGVDFSASPTPRFFFESGKLFISSLINANLNVLSGGEINFKSGSSCGALSKFHVDTAIVDTAMTISDLDITSSLTLNAATTITKFNAPPIIYINADSLTVGSFTSSSNTTITALSAANFTVTKSFNFYASILQLVKTNFVVSKPTTEVNFPQSVTITSGGYFSNYGTITFSNALNLILPDISDFVNYQSGILIFNATAPADIIFEYSISGANITGKVYNLGLIISKGMAQFKFNGNVPYYQCPTGEFEIEPPAGGLLVPIPAEFSTDCVFRGKFTIDFPTIADLNKNNKSMFAQFVRPGAPSDKKTPIGDAIGVVEIGGVPELGAAICLDPTSFQNGGPQARTYYNVFANNPPAANSDFCAQFSANSIRGSPYCEYVPSPAPGVAPTPATTTSNGPPPTTTNSNPPSSASVIGITISFAMIALSLVF